MTKYRPPNVVAAMARGDRERLRVLGSIGGQVSGANRHAEAVGRRTLADVHAFVVGSEWVETYWLAGNYHECPPFDDALEWLELKEVKKELKRINLQGFSAQ
jgi:hypothetical protein